MKQVRIPYVCKVNVSICCVHIYIGHLQHLNLNYYFNVMYIYIFKYTLSTGGSYQSIVRTWQSSRSVDSDVQTLLHMAAERGDAETCQLLVSVVLYECLFCKVLLLMFMCILI